MFHIDTLHFLPKLNFRSKLIISYLLLATIPVLFIVYLYNMYSVKSIREHTLDNITGTLMQIRDNVEYTTDNVKRISDNLFYNREFQMDLNKTYDQYGAYDFMAPQRKLDNQLRSTLLMYPDQIMLTLYINNHTLPQRYTTITDDNPLNGNQKYDIFYLEKLQEQEWYSLLDLNLMDVVWTQVGTDTLYNNISLIRPLIDLPTMKQYGVLQITVSMTDIFEAIDYRKIGQESCLVIINESNDLLYGSAADIELLNNWGQDLKDYLVISEKIPNTGWTVEAVIPQSSLERDAGRVRQMAVYICTVSFFFLVIISILITRIFSSKVTRIASSLDAFKEGEFYHRIEITGNDEFNKISRSFNEMAATIDDLIKKVYISNIQKKEAEFEALQAQINPHFLYNTLSSISRLAQFGELDKLDDMVKGLAKFYRLTLSKGKTLIPISDELQQAMAYINIQRIKYGERLTVSYDIDSSVLQHTTVKLILQPIVENSIKHAWYGKTMHLRIVISRAGGTIIFNVIDNGIGMSRESLDQNLCSNKNLTGFGINNVNKRIKLQYGEEYGLSIYSRLGIGTNVEIKIPVSNIY